MQSPEPFDNKYTPEEVEVEIETDDFPPVDTRVSFATTLAKVKTWYGSLSTPAQVVVAVAGVFMTFSILTAILRLVSAVLSALILAAIFYLIYRYILKPKF
ncbi:MAG: hypothetical protein EWV53_14145 [Microcystis panniformis Mp_MB_F_20051200_S9]|uniref:Uncharacterized protein n=1 Tax=Microcystis panniformis Mp_MB_F_20051200_S9 TaxID=2486223 RepID=A0A552PUP3_9CHRO|nr:MAG: hypothetical protein EWV43_10370 [Microcystis panniformis Mp_MB_F_20080800_S26D]TRV49962.1 MAG: hypothetical protein EWV87_09350 [Microcystis panniformis Mp_GB_SS_20050300_S99]TRV55479.1 MAG: hypothetical protein EWV42_01560 [Microcystis panniformis Mp_GB_SS_20050300_S99D]TRV60713.1 MAG: hypothetical protein EWV53_14145 [Microcystis panniformis Mp_MB_F_20051200_S9]TRV61753.1 MAG: hypothetical protein EWV69_07180 [Microcystis panniformis Mp_MB_F_20080800_S26]TRV66810.1 MAG: hypothetical